jgi:hypothetical protein
MLKGKRRIGSFKVPLLNGGKLGASSILEFAKHAISKPANYLGAPHVADKVAQGRNVQMCEICWRKYYGWWRKECYRPNWDIRFTSNCDGCGDRMVQTVMFVREDQFFTVFADNHGRYPEPNRRIFTP